MLANNDITFFICVVLQVLQQNLSAEDDVNMNIWMLMFEFFIKMGKLTDARNCLSELKKIIRSDKSMYHVHYAVSPETSH